MPVHRRIIFLAVLLLLAAGPVWSTGISKAREIKFAGLTALIDSGVEVMLIDARAPTPYLNGHIPTAVNIPGYLFDDDIIPGLPPDRSTPIVTYCRGGHCGVSWYAADRLLDMGYTKVFVYNGGSEGWQKSGNVLITKKHEGLPQIKLDDLKALLATGANVRLRDAREPAQFAAFSLPGAKSLPLPTCRPGAAGMPPSADDLVVVFGQSRWDGRAFHVADRLRAWGFKKVRVFTGGVHEWRKQ